MREKKRAIIIALILSLIFILSVVWTTHQFLAKQEAASAAIYQNGTLIKIISTDHEETFRIEDGEDWNEITVDKDLYAYRVERKRFSSDCVSAKSSCDHGSTRRKG